MRNMKILYKQKLKIPCLQSKCTFLVNSTSLIDELNIEVRLSNLLMDSMKESKKKKFDLMKCLSVCYIFTT